jgi:hypothetical protein
MTRSRPEQQIQRAVFEHLAIRAASTVFAFHPANGGWRSRVEAAVLKGMGVRAGVPDIIPGWPGGWCAARARDAARDWPPTPETAPTAFLWALLAMLFHGMVAKG